MLLKKIILSGFKSFADRIVLNFDSGITGIVGPNGSGKSNVIDAVRWVMGEQNAKSLRGEVATDIIFAGSEKRKSLGMAEVSLIFDNTKDDGFCPPEYRHLSEVSISRRIYKDGNREYLLNNRTCRLKDIINFFTLAGLAGKNYSMIQQGQVDRILNSKPEDIREMLEDAAGTLIYKKQRAEAEKKLEQTRLNLNRLEDIVTELEKRKEKLEAQVEKAKRWKALSEDLRNKELSLFAHNFHLFHEEKAKIQQQIEEEFGNEEEQIESIKDLESRLTSLKRRLDESSPEIQTFNSQVTKIREEIARAEASLVGDLDKLSSNQERMEAIQEELEEDSERVKNLEDKYKAIQESREKSAEKFDTINNQIEEISFRLEEVDESSRVFEGKFDEIADSLNELNLNIQKWELKKESLEKELETAGLKRESFHDRLSNIKSDIGEASEWFKECEKKLNEQQSGLQEQINAKHDIERQVSQLLDEKNKCKQDASDCKEKLISCETKLASMESMELANQSANETFDVLAAENELKDEIVYLGEAITLKQDIEEIAKEKNCSLGPAFFKCFDKWVSRIVIKDQLTLNKIIRKAPDLSINSFHLSLADGFGEQDKYAAFAAKYNLRPIAEFIDLEYDNPTLHLKPLLNSLFYIEDKHISQECLNEKPASIVLFNQSGLVIHSRFDVHVSGQEASSGSIYQKYESEHLEHEIADYKRKISEFQSRIDKLDKQIAALNEQVEQADGDLDSQNSQIIELMADYQSSKQQVEIKTEYLQNLEKEREEFEAGLQEHSGMLEQLESDLEKARGDKENLEEERAELKESTADRMELKEELKRQYDDLKIEKASFKAEHDSIDSNYQMVKEQYEITGGRLSKRQAEYAKLKSQLDELGNTESKHKEQIRELVLEREHKEEKLRELQSQNSDLVEEIKLVEKTLKDNRDKHEKIQKMYSESKLKLERLNIACDGVADQALEKYHLKIEDYEFERDPKFDAKEQSKTVSKIKADIESMGPINMMALNEYEELLQRATFINAQKDEVLSSIDLLMDAIDEISESSKEKFLAIFKTINAEFSQLFPILFRGGEAKLEMTDEQNPLEGGVDIICRLPGKAYRKMNLFSGGEKALTAISLIFALLKTKPTPFCFLDEVDAPLDEANVGRYNNVLQALSDKFQFIVITHNRRTMEVLDTLYGVTMQEPGVSKVVGVDMNKDLPDHLKKAFKKEESAGKESKSAKRAGASAAPSKADSSANDSSQDASS